MSKRSRYARGVTVGLALTLGLVFAPRAMAEQHGAAPAGPRGGGSSGHVSSGHSSSHTPSHIGSRSEGHGGSRGPVRTSPVPPRSGSHGDWGGGHSWGGHSWGGGSSWGRHWYPRWYRNWYWGYTPYWAAYGWLWGWPWYYDPFFSDWRYVEAYGDGPTYYGSVYGWRSGHGSWAARFGRVKTDVEPDEAEVWLNGKYVGTADDFDGFPDYLYLEPGSYKLEFRLPGYQTWTADASPGRGEVIRLKHHLDRDKGKGRLDSFLPASKGMPFGRFFGKDGEPMTPEAARGRYRDRDRDGKHEDGDDAPMGIDDRDRPRGDARPEMDDDDDDADRSPAPEAAAKPAERMPPRDAEEKRSADARARLRWNVTPEDAAVWVDDQYVGTGDELSSRPRGTYIASGKHTVTVVRPGYKSRTVEVEAKAGEAVDVTVELEK